MFGRVACLLCTTCWLFVPTPTTGQRWTPTTYVDLIVADSDLANHPFAQIAALALVNDGPLVVLDRLADDAVAIFNEDGSLVHSWGQRGQGPGEMTLPQALAISDQGDVAVANGAIVSVHTLAGDLRRTLRVDGMPSALAFDSLSQVVALVVPVPSTASPEVEIRIERLADDVTFWRRSMPSVIRLVVPRPRLLMAARSGSNVVVGLGSAYEMAVVDVNDGRIIGRIARDTKVRPIDDGLAVRIADFLTGRRDPPEGWTSLIGVTGKAAVPVAMEELIEIAGNLPVLHYAFWGPPGSTLWVNRGIGIDDSFAPSAERPDDSLALYDLFREEDLEYIGTTRAPEGAILMAGDSSRVAAVVVDSLGVQSVRVMRVALP